MVSSFNKSLLVGLALSAMASPAFSSSITANVQFWSYNASPFGGPLTQASEGNPIIGTTPTATFTYSGDLNWDSISTNNVGAFIHPANVGGISNFVSAGFGNGAPGVTNFLNAPLSVSGDSQATFWRFTGFLSTTGAAGSITHDDGTSFYVAGNPLISSPGETPSDTDLWFAGPFNNAPFVIDYFAGNGVPEILHFNVTDGSITTGVPEPSTWLMMIAGFLCVGSMAYRRRNQGTAFRVA